MNKIIKALQDELEKEINSSKGLHPLTELHFKMGLKAANAFWLPLIEKALEMAEFYGNKDKWVSQSIGMDPIFVANDLEYRQSIGMYKGGKKAREFLTLLTLKGEIK